MPIKRGFRAYPCPPAAGVAILLQRIAPLHRCYGFFTIRVRKKRLGSVPLYSPGLADVQFIKSELHSRITSHLVPASCGIAAGGLVMPARVMLNVATFPC